MDYSSNSIRSSIRALETVIAPAVIAGSDAQAREQLALVVDALRFLETRLVDLPARADFTLRNTLALAENVYSALVDDAPAAADLLSAALDAGRRASDSQGSMREADEATAALTGALRDVLRTWPAISNTAARALVVNHVLNSERRRIEADRAWFAPLGFDPRPETVRSLSQAWS